MTKLTNDAQRHAIKAAMRRSLMFLVTGPNKSENLRAYNRHLCERRLEQAVEQALLAGDVPLALRINEIYVNKHHDAVATGEAQPPAKPRRKVARSGSLGKRAKAELRKRGVVVIGPWE